MANGTNNERIILGSGKVYIVAFTDEIRRTLQSKQRITSWD